MRNCTLHGGLGVTQLFPEGMILKCRWLERHSITSYKPVSQKEKSHRAYKKNLAKQTGQTAIIPKNPPTFEKLISVYVKVLPSIFNKLGVAGAIL